MTFQSANINSWSVIYAVFFFILFHSRPSLVGDDSLQSSLPLKEFVYRRRQVFHLFSLLLKFVLDTFLFSIIFTPNCIATVLGYFCLYFSHLFLGASWHFFFFRPWILISFNRIFVWDQGDNCPCFFLIFYFFFKWRRNSYFPFVDVFDQWWFRAV